MNIVEWNQSPECELKGVFPLEPRRTLDFQTYHDEHQAKHRPTD